MLHRLVARLKANPGYTGDYPPDPVKHEPPEPEQPAADAFAAIKQVQELAETLVRLGSVLFEAHGQSWYLLRGNQGVFVYWGGSTTDRLVAYGSHPYQKLTIRQMAEVYIGQIMVGTRDSGYGLPSLRCGTVMSDQPIPGHIVI